MLTIFLSWKYTMTLLNILIIITIVVVAFVLWNTGSNVIITPSEGFLTLKSREIAYLTEKFREFILDGMHSLDPSHEETITKIIRRVPNSQFLFLIKDEKPVGMLRFYNIVYHPDCRKFPEEIRRKGFIYVSSVYVHPEFRKQGYGTLLFQKLSKENPHLCLEVFQNSQALHLYQKLGFQIVDSYHSGTWFMIK